MIFHTPQRGVPKNPLFEGRRYSTRGRIFARRMRARGWPMAKRSAKKARQAFWERGYLSHGYWYGKERLGTVELGAKKDWDGVYRWRAGNHAGEAGSLEEAKRAVEQAALIGASQLKLFDRT